MARDISSVRLTLTLEQWMFLREMATGEYAGVVTGAWRRPPPALVVRALTRQELEAP
jgi:hypothetical protein